MADETAVTPMRVFFLCTHNSSRSQMAERLLRTRGGDRYAVFSAGTHPCRMHPLAIRATAEIGIDRSLEAGYRAKDIEEFAGQPPMDLVVTVCDEAAEEYPFFPGARRQEHRGFPDPSAATGTEEERLAVFRQVRDGLAARIGTVLRAPGASTSSRHTSATLDRVECIASGHASTPQEPQPRPLAMPSKRAQYRQTGSDWSRRSFAVASVRCGRLCHPAPSAGHIEADAVGDQRQEEVDGHRQRIDRIAPGVQERHPIGARSGDGQEANHPDDDPRPAARSNCQPNQSQRRQAQRESERHVDLERQRAVSQGPAHPRQRLVQILRERRRPLGAGMD